MRTCVMFVLHSAHDRGGGTYWSIIGSLGEGVCVILLRTRMHSSRMRTARSLTVSRRILCTLPRQKPRMPPQQKP